jgi:hypothetical protein
MRWKIEHKNDTVPNDEGFYEWWEITDGQQYFKAYDAASAKWLRDILNVITPRFKQAEPGDEVPGFAEKSCAVVEIENFNPIMQAIMAQSLAYFADDLNTGEYVSGGVAITHGKGGTLKLTSDLIIRRSAGQ